jgi:hypothetical protein
MILQIFALFSASSLNILLSSEDQQSIFASWFGDTEPDDSRNFMDPISDDSETERESEEESSKDESKIYELAELSTERLFIYRNLIFHESDIPINSSWEKIPTPPPEYS